MKQRSLIQTFLLTIFTFGLYRLYWFIATRKEMMRADKKIKIVSPWILVLPFVFLSLAVGVLVASGHNQREALNSSCQEPEIKVVDDDNNVRSVEGGCAFNPPMYAVAFFYLSCASFLPLIAIWFWSYSKAVERITKEKITFALSMIILFVVPDGLDILLLQDAFNKVTPAKKLKKATA